MPEFFPSLSDKLRDWAMAQPVFFVSSAPLHGRHVNCSPKGYAQSNFAVLGPNLCAYADRTGSGCETIAHLYENGRATLMFCSFGTRPRIMRLFCRGSVIEWNHPDFQSWLDRMGLPGGVDSARAVLVFDIYTVQTSCGYGVPMIRRKGLTLGNGNGNVGAQGTTAATVVAAANANAENGSSIHDVEKQDLGVLGFEDRTTLQSHNKKSVEKGTLISYRAQNNIRSLDGLPGLRSARRDAGQSLLAGDVATRARGVLAQKEGVALGFMLAVLLYSVLRLIGRLV